MGGPDFIPVTVAGVPVESVTIQRERSADRRSRAGGHVEEGAVDIPWIFKLLRNPSRWPVSIPG